MKDKTMNDTSTLIYKPTAGTPMETPQPSGQLQTLVEKAPEVGDMFTTLAAFEAAQRMATALSKMEILPSAYRNNIPNCMMLLNLSHAFRHLGVSPFMIAQQLVPVNGKYGWQGQFVIAIINASKRFAEDLEFQFSGKDDDYGCEAVTKTREGKEIRGAKVTWKMVKGEGWSGKTGSKWNTMPEQMFRYRAGAFFGRAYAGDLMMGLQTVEELIDTGIKDVSPATDKGADLTDMILGKPAKENSLDNLKEIPVKAEPEKWDVPAREPTLSATPSGALPLPKGVKLSDVGKLRKDSVVNDVD